MDSVEDIDTRLDGLTNAIHEALSASAQKSHPAKQPLVSIPPMILANIREKNRLKRQWQRIGRMQNWSQSLREGKILQNRRPISLLSCLRKVYERILLNRLSSQIVANNLVPEEQFGFMPGCSS